MSEQSGEMLPRASLQRESAVVALRGGLRRAIARWFRPWVASVLFGIVFFGAWEAISGWLINAAFISSPTRIILAVWELLLSGDLWFHGRLTIWSALVGFVGGLLAGALLGLVLGRNRLAARVLDPFVVALYAVPALALAPLFILWFGIGPEMKYGLVALVTFFPVFMNSYIGAKDVDKDLLDVLRMMGAARHTTFVKVVVPSTLIWVFAACRLALPNAIGVALVGEMIVSSRGLGFLALYAAGRFNTSALFALLFIVVLTGVLLFKLLTYIEGRVLGWKAAEGKGFM